MALSPDKPATWRWRDVPLTVLGVLLLGIGVWFLVLGLRLLLEWGAIDAIPVVEVFRPAGALVYLGLGASLVAMAWWLGGGGIRRWWWWRNRRQRGPSE